MTMLLTRPADVAAVPVVSLIDQAEELVLQLEGLLIQMSDRDRNNLGQLADMLGQAAGRRDDLVAEALQDMRSYMGPGNRVMDQLDRDEAEEAQERAAAAVATAALAAGPWVVIEKDEPHTLVRAMVLVRDDCPYLSFNTYMIDRASAEQWAREQIALGKLFAVSVAGEA